MASTEFTHFPGTGTAADLLPLKVCHSLAQSSGLHTGLEGRTLFGHDTSALPLSSEEGALAYFSQYGVSVL